MLSSIACVGVNRSGADVGERGGNLLEGALPRGLIFAPAQQFCAVAEALAGDVVEAHLHHQFGAQRLPFGAAVRAPSARTAGGFAGEAWRLAEGFELARKARAFGVGDRRGEADVVEFAGSVVQAE